MNTPAHRVLFARLDNLGDVLLAGPAVRAVAAAAEVVFLAGPAGAAGASLLPGVSRVLCFDSPWTGDHAPPPARAAIGALVTTLASARLDEALVLTSFHQSPLPLALLLKMAGVARVGAVCVDHPGSLLDLRHPYQPELHEVEQALALAEAFGYPLPAGDDRRLALAPWGMAAPPPRAELARPYVVVHPGASAPARALPPGLAAAAVDALAARGWAVAVTGSRAEAALTRLVAGPGQPGVVDLGGQLELRQLAGLLAGAAAVVAGNTGPAHLAAAVGAPVVSVFAPVVPAHRWRPWGGSSAVLGRQDAPCAGCRARSCPLPRQLCVDDLDGAALADAVETVAARTPHTAADAPSLAGAP